MPGTTRRLKASEAAWLARVNDDRVRAWFRDASYGTEAEPDGPRTTTTWEELASYCRGKGKRPPLPVEMLDVDAGVASRMLVAVTPSARSAGITEGHDAGDSRKTEGVSPMLAGGDGRPLESELVVRLRQNLARARVREDGLREALREALASNASAQDQLASLRRSVEALIDGAERLTHIDDLS